MLNEQQFRLRLNDVHILISDVLEHVDERAFASADAALENMQAEIGRLRGHVWSNLNVRSVLPSASLQPPPRATRELGRSKSALPATHTTSAAC